MKRPTKPGIYKFTCTEQAGLPVSVGDWAVGIVFKEKDPCRNKKFRWSFYGVGGSDSWAHGFSFSLYPFIGKGTFELIK